MVTATLPLALASALALGMGAHPIHTTLTELRAETHDGVETVELTVRLFADDFATIARGSDAGSGYLARAIRITSGDGRVLALAACGLRRQGEVIWICLRARGAGPLSGGWLRDRVLFDRFPDQVNIVQATYGGRRQTLLLTPGDGERRLP